jgi:hypothetical protein
MLVIIRQVKDGRPEEDMFRKSIGSLAGREGNQRIGPMVPRAALEWAVLEAVACELQWRCRVGPGRCPGAERCDRVRGSEKCIESLCEAAIREAEKGS